MITVRKKTLDMSYVHGINKTLDMSHVYGTNKILDMSDLCHHRKQNFCEQWELNENWVKGLDDIVLSRRGINDRSLIRSRSDRTEQVFKQCICLTTTFCPGCRSLRLRAFSENLLLIYKTNIELLVQGTQEIILQIQISRVNKRLSIQTSLTM